MTQQPAHADQGLTEMMFAHLNGDLSAEERTRFEAMLSERPDARGELADWQALRHELEARKQERAPEAGLDAFTSRLRAARPQAQPRRKFRLVESIERWVQSIYSPLGYAAALLLVVVQAGFLAALVSDSLGGDQAGHPSATQVRSINGPTAAALRVRFRPEATAREIASTLSNAGVRIADGPGQGGFYALNVPAESRDAAIAALRKSAAIDELIEGPNAAETGPR